MKVYVEGLGGWLSGKRVDYANMRSRVWIPTSYVKSWARQLMSVISSLEGETGGGFWKAPWPSSLVNLRVPDQQETLSQDRKWTVMAKDTRGRSLAPMSVHVGTCAHMHDNPHKSSQENKGRLPELLRQLL